MKTMEVIALCMWLANSEGKLELIEHTYKESLGECLRSSRIAQRELDPMRAKFACGKVTAMVALIEKIKTHWNSWNTKTRIAVVAAVVIVILLII